MEIKMQNIAYFMMLFIVVSTAQANPQIKHLQFYQKQGITKADKSNGEKLWFSSINKRSCSSCHGATPDETGSHVKTLKTIKPMAFSVNPERYQNSKKLEKWFLRNCKWTFGRECSAQEKVDILSWLSNQ